MWAVFFALGSALALPLWRLAFLALLERRTFRTRLLIVGAGEAGRTILEAIRAEAAPLYEVVGFIDDDPELAGRTVAELPVLGGRGRRSCLHSAVWARRRWCWPSPTGWRPACSGRC